MSNMDQTRPYRLKRRAERQDETRRRITEATMALHEEIGPAATTISAIAERAGVERLTVYRHFPEESELLRACQSHFLAAHPMPDIGAWTAIADPDARLRRALADLYARYDATEAMTAHVLRDAPGMPALAALIKDMPAYYLAARVALAAPFAAPAAPQSELLAAVGHALDFETWRSLVRRQGLTVEQAIDLMVAFIARVATGG